MALYLLIVVPAICALYLYKVWKALRSPLNTIPGPWYNKFTGLATLYSSLVQFRQAQHLHELHAKYGPFVRTAPNEVDIADISCFQEIHRLGSKYAKSDFYHFLSPIEGGKRPYGVFQMTDEHEHSKRRRVLGKGFSVSYLRTHWEGTVRTKVEAAIRGIKSDAVMGHSNPDIRKWCVLMASDVISHLMFGRSFDGLKVGKPDPFFDWLRQANIGNMVAYSMPNVYALFKYIPVQAIQNMFIAHDKLLARADEAIVNSRANASPDLANVFASVLAQDEKDGGLTEDDICAEVGSFIVAGTETTSNTLTYAIWSVLCDPTLQSALEEEVATLPDPLTDSKLEQLEILNAVLQEALRLYMAVPGPQPRVVPHGGAEMGGHFFPEGTIVTTQAYTLHRDPTAFPDPERFDHTRFLPNGSAITSGAAKIAYTPYGCGARVCIGKNLAQMSMRLTIAEFFRQCRGAKLCASTTPESMEMKNFLLVQPKGEVCRVVLPGIKH